MDTQNTNVSTQLPNNIIVDTNKLQQLEIKNTADCIKFDINLIINLIIGLFVTYFIYIYLYNCQKMKYEYMENPDNNYILEQNMFKNLSENEKKEYLNMEISEKMSYLNKKL